MKKIVWIIILVLILVSINWLRNGFAQTTDEQIKEYQELLKNKSVPIPPASPGTYTTPPIYTGNDQPTETGTLDDHRRNATASDADTADASFSEDNHQLVLPDANKVTRFGDSFFSSPPIGEINSGMVPDDYVLGPGDNLIINLWGRVQQEWNLTIDRQGKVFIPKVGEITAWGMTIGVFEEELDRQLSKVYSGFKRKVTLGKIRTIRVFVYGAVKSPGGYAVSALSSLFSVLYRAGGPAGNGSFRQIKLIRDNKTTQVDLYDFLISGDKSCDLPLMSGDVVFVPLVGAQAAIRGEVKRSGIYELVGGEKISDLLALAGGPTADAYLGRLMLDRISTDDSRELIDINFADENRQDMDLCDGDDLSVFSMYQMRQNIVWITGMVKHPGTFERSDGMCIADLLKKGQVLPNNVYRGRADLYRNHPDGKTEIIPINLDDTCRTGNACPLQDRDSLHVYSIFEVERKKFVYIDGQVQNPGKYPLYENMTVNDLIFLAGNLQDNAYMLSAELARIDNSGRTSVLQIPLDRDEDGTGLALRENDHLYIRTIPGYQFHRTVTIEGEVRFPGIYSLSHKDETLYELLHRAGGFTDKAFPLGTVFKRHAIIDDLQRKDIGAILESSKPLIADTAGNLLPVRTAPINEESMDRIIIDMDRLLTSAGGQGDFTLQAGDYIYVPEIPTGISVLGEISANGTIKYEPGKKVKYYLDQAGGFTKRADKGETRLVKADGRVFTSNNTMHKDVGLGDVIIVPAEIKKQRDWLKIFATSASIITGVATSVLIIDRL